MPELQHISSISSRPLEQLEPSPVDEEPPTLWPDGSNIKDGNIVNPEDLPEGQYSSYFPPSKSGISGSTTNSIGISHSRIPSILLSIQKYSTVGPALYLMGHFANTALIPLFTLSTQKAEKSLLLTRPYYQSFPLEPLLIFVPIVAHVASGLSLRIYRRFQTAKRYGAETHAQRQKMTKALWPKLTLTSALGYALYPMMAAHILVNRITPLKVHGDSSSVGLRFFSHGMKRHPWLASAGYTIMVSVASWHFVGGAAKYLRLTREYVTEGGDFGMQKRQWRDRVVTAVSAMVAIAWVIGGVGVVGRGVGAAPASAWEVKQWDQVYKAIPVVGGLM